MADGRSGPALEADDHSRIDLAEDRTVWARRRTLLANERTFAAWIRTGLACIATGFGATRLLARVNPDWMVTGLGAVLVLLGVAALWLGLQSYRACQDILGEDAKPTLSTGLVKLLTAAFGLVALASFVVLAAWT